MQSQDISKFKMLSDVEHVLLRSGRYIGGINPKTVNDWIIKDGKVVWEEQTFVPAFDKLFDEVISNSSDHAKRPEGAHLNKISVTVNKLLGTICVTDNGGIPVKQHPDNGLWIPDMIFGHLRSGSNFDDDPDSTTTGQNGEGSSLVNIFSSFFRVETSDGVNSFDITYKNNMSEKTVPIIKPYKVGFTRITFTPDFPRLNMVAIDDNVMARIERRCWEIAATNPKIEVSFNGKILDIKSFKDFVSLFSPEVVYQESDRWNIGLVYSVDGFKHTSFVNSTLTFEGGTHIEYVMGKVIEGVREHIEKKTKQKIKPSEIKSQFHLFLDATINNPRYSSQTKENLITSVSDYGSQFVLEDKTVKAIINSSIMKSILSWAERKKKLDEMKEAEEQADKIKKSHYHHIEKYRPATEKDRSKCVLFLAEGDSAANPLKAVAGKNHGVFPLRGKPINTFDASVKTLMTQNEFQSILAIMNLNISGSIDIEKLRYHTLAVSTDADLDGSHIRGLLVVAFNRFWPQLIELGVLKFLRTPVVIAKQGKNLFEFFTPDEFKKWEAEQTKPYTSKYYKGLGSHEESNMERFMNDPKYMYTVSKMDVEDTEMLKLAFDPSKADERKVWLGQH